ncbi:unnamed protein product [Cuscuta epithymum]|uniref:Uncharacterized protein n=1 Tax=Cuscuta epithymum TaxID=186058 RepID=A0AAV0DCM2_9ASTE|nr:unnamed protein product [Cuscuta epithymum]
MICVMNSNGCLINSLQAYHRKLPANELMKFSTKFGPRCPSIFKRKRTKRQRATEYCIRFMDNCKKKKLLPSKYKLRRSSKQHSWFTISRLNLSSQIEAGICDPESFKCQLSLSPIVKSTRKRSKRIPRSYSSFLRVSHSAMVESTDSELICHAEHSYKKEDPPAIMAASSSSSVRKIKSSTLNYEPSVYCYCGLKSPLCTGQQTGRMFYGCQQWKRGMWVFPLERCARFKAWHSYPVAILQ